MLSLATFPWTYDMNDPAVRLFTAAVDRFRLVIEPGSAVLELGCAETDWLERMRDLDQGYDLYGVDARAERTANGWRFVHGDATRRHLFPPRSFDWIVLLGALEHFGLGFYGDPVVEGGDILTMQNVVRWLKPGGYVYFDVPVQPTHRIQDNRHFRMYSPETLTDRLLAPGLEEIQRAYAHHEPHVWLDGPPAADVVPYDYGAVLARKVVP